MPAWGLAVVGTGGDLGHAPARRVYEKAGFVGLPLVRYYARLDTDAGHKPALSEGAGGPAPLTVLDGDLGCRRRCPAQARPSSSATTSTMDQALPSSAVQLRRWSRPTTMTRLPLLSTNPAL